MPEITINKDYKRKGQYFTFDGVQFVVDTIIPETKEEPASLTGHYILIKDKNETLTLPPVTLKAGQGTLLDGVKIKTRFKIKYS